MNHHVRLAKGAVVDLPSLSIGHGEGQTSAGDVSSPESAVDPLKPNPKLTLERKFMGGGARYPYPKAVWSPAGGWWTRPSNWRANTVIAFAGIIGVTYGVWNLSADKEWRYVQPDRQIPSMKWAKQYKDQNETSSST